MDDNKTITRHINNTNQAKLKLFVKVLAEQIAKADFSSGGPKK